jgi:hypothetical protein
MLEQHFKEVTLDWCEWSKNTRLTVKYYIHSCFDGERGLSLYSVWLDNQPFMLCQDAGRGNQDYNTQYITDREVYQQALNYLLTLTPTQEEPVIYPPEKNIADLDQYYGWLTADLYNPDLKPNFKVGDIVLAEVLENHNRDLYAANPVKVWTRCKVLAVNPVNPTFTYQLKQLDRRWETEEEAAAGLRRRFEQMITDTDKGEVEASGNDTTVKPIAS